jgi:hypothetical protein
MFLASVAVHPPFEVSRVSTAFVRLGASLENHVRMFLLKKSREARSCSYLGCPCTHLRYSTSKVSNVTKTFWTDHLKNVFHWAQPFLWKLEPLSLSTKTQIFMEQEGWA